MAGRRLTPEEHVLWSRVARTVRPLPRHAAISMVAETEDAAPAMRLPKPGATKQPVPAPAPVAPKTVRRPADVLDSSWERRITKGAAVPDFTIDLHGHSLDAAHRHLETALSAALLKGARVLLVVTGKPREAGHVAGERMRGAIRAEIGHWLARSTHADAIASVRVAHPRHGGSGALYVILRRNG